MTSTNGEDSIEQAADASGSAPADVAAHAADSEALLALVHETLETLLRRGISAADLAPLMRLRDVVGNLDTSGSGSYDFGVPHPSSHEARNREN
ncbi:MAG: hypothetical protein VX871_07075, partial [Pseudomonadota bacterium]|nr:hypothetical protein [Pseudomonadota bacterium]